MKILVIDDSANHLATAVQTLSDEHDVTTCSSYDKAVRLVDGEWDAVLCDLLMPAGVFRMGKVGMAFAGTEMPVGWSLALLAVRAGAKFVAVVTDTNHHDHPASAMLDEIGDHVFSIDGAKMLMTNQIELVEIGGTSDKGKDWRDILNRLLNA